MEVNLKQVGGDHYRTAYQHWDLVEDHGIGYLEGCASKYVTRWRRRGGVSDLRKARHYIEKTHDLHAKRLRPPRGMATGVAVRRYGEANGLDEKETRAVYLICSWASLADLQEIMALLDDMIMAADAA